jgi:LmbE family N-acetylglucosaminyl deacetylase
MSFRSRLRPLKRAAARIVERFWRLGFAGAAYVVRQDANRWTSPGRKQVLVVAPHPDDEAMGCVGTILLHVQAGDRTCVAIATDGRQSKAIRDPDEMSHRRRREATDAARLMDIDRLEWIGFPEGGWNVLHLKERRRRLIDEIRPDIMYAPSRIDFHPEHFAVAHALALALGEVDAMQSRDLRVRIYQIQVPLTSIMTNLVADISAVLPQCEAALGAYGSQAASIECTYRQRRYSTSWHRMTGHAEEFWELPASRYIALHRELPAHWPKVFRGLRNFPLSDPLAYLAGMNERQRIKAGDCPLPLHVVSESS